MLFSIPERTRFSPPNVEILQKQFHKHANALMRLVNQCRSDDRSTFNPTASPSIHQDRDSSPFFHDLTGWNTSRIIAYNTLMRKLETLRRAIVSHPIHFVPLDVFILILTSPAIINDYKSRHDTRLSLLQVCKSWESVVLSHSTFWSYLDTRFVDVRDLEYLMIGDSLYTVSVCYQSPLDLLNQVNNLFQLSNKIRHWEAYDTGPIFPMLSGSETYVEQLYQACAENGFDQKLSYFQARVFPLPRVDELLSLRSLTLGDCAQPNNWLRLPVLQNLILHGHDHLGFLASIDVPCLESLTLGARQSERNMHILTCLALFPSLKSLEVLNHLPSLARTQALTSKIAPTDYNLLRFLELMVIEKLVLTDAPIENIPTPDCLYINASSLGHNHWKEIWCLKLDDTLDTRMQGDYGALCLPLLHSLELASRSAKRLVAFVSNLHAPRLKCFQGVVIGGSDLYNQLPVASYLDPFSTLEELDITRIGAIRIRGEWPSLLKLQMQPHHISSPGDDFYSFPQLQWLGLQSYSDSNELASQIEHVMHHVNPQVLRCLHLRFFKSTYSLVFLRDLQALEELHIKIFSLTAPLRSDADEPFPEAIDGAMEELSANLRFWPKLHTISTDQPPADWDQLCRVIRSRASGSFLGGHVSPVKVEFPAKPPKMLMDRLEAALKGEEFVPGPEQLSLYAKLANNTWCQWCGNPKCEKKHTCFKWSHI